MQIVVDYEKILQPFFLYSNGNVVKKENRRNNGREVGALCS